MRIRNIVVFFILIAFGVGLSGCKDDPVVNDISGNDNELIDDNNNENTENNIYKVELYEDDVLLYEYLDVLSGDNVVLPNLDNKDDLMFVGWSDGSDVFYGEYGVDEDLILNAYYENPSEVFTYDINDYNQDWISITGYTGMGKYLKIPQVMDGKIVTSIGGSAFFESNIIEVVLPIDSGVGIGGFHSSTDLKKVTFYGNHMVVKELQYSTVEYNAILEELGDSCIINEDTRTETSWEFLEGCTLKEVTNVTGLIVFDVEYYTYTANVYDYKGSPYDIVFSNSAFGGCTSLETLEIPSTLGKIYDFCSECSALKEIILADDNPLFELVDGVLYNEDLTSLELYPSSLEATEFIIPDSVIMINLYAFYINTSLEKITLGSSVEQNPKLDGIILLEDIRVHEDNERFFSDDGVLYSDDDGVLRLVSYPASKAGIRYKLLEGTIQIGSYSFKNNKYLESIDLGEDLRFIRDQAFADSKSIKILDLPETVTGVYSFITMGSSIEIILINKVYDYYYTEAITWFNRDDSVPLAVYVPDESYDEYITQRSFEDHLDQIFRMSEYTE